MRPPVEGRRLGRTVGVVVAIAIALGLAACGDSEGDSAADGSKTVALRLNFPWYASDHAWFTTGMEEGIYAKAGITLKPQEGTGGATVLKLVASGSDPIGLVDAGSVIKGEAAGLPVTSVGCLNQRNPMAVIVKADSPVQTIEDLKGKTLAVGPGDVNAVLWPAVLQTNGMSTDDTSFVQTADASSKMSTMLSGKADAFLGFWTLQPFVIETAMDTKVRSLKYSDYGVDALGLCIVVNDKWAEDNSALLEKFLAATQESIDVAVQDPEAAAADYVKVVDTGDETIALGQIKASIDLLHSAATDGEPYLVQDAGDWATTSDLMTEYGDVDAPDGGPEAYFTNDYLEAAAK
jgi:NitT/TauT family transport system substrate-binding protein